MTNNYLPYIVAPLLLSRACYVVIHCSATAKVRGLSPTTAQQALPVSQVARVVAWVIASSMDEHPNKEYLYMGSAPRVKGIDQQLICFLS